MFVLINILTVLFTIIAMECLSWFIHKYLFHGPLWFLHKSHHQKAKSFFEWNDLFALLFAGLSLLLMYIGRKNFDYRFFVGLGITLYGLIYFMVHDWFVHRRFKTFKSTNTYLLAVRKAHKMHHKNRGREKGKAFGLLFVRKDLIS
ncbi:fatty acid hydroxylase [Pedobacter sp. HDW13]|uniref:sterol desaturase family protein n=2 Tax=unclassified Pedobacter TaxID=2628915 RepID=UPI000F5A18B8|nr:sterol desaturase family protein [Pedobacter sp. KBW01]QIL39979.1 fatty acid hydroxylase [Pedobacter sp. HDW13]RQO64254.1 fatty acid hydroxylase [Pedobacter sp. KBW01]